MAVLVSGWALIADILKGNALGERAAVNAAHTVRVDGLIRDGGLCRAGLAVTLVLAENGINFFFLGAGELFGLFGFAGYHFSGQWPLPPVPFGIAAQGRRKRCWSDRAFPWGAGNSTAVLIRNISGAADIAGAIWGCMGYTVLLCFCLFKTGSISKSVFGAH